MAVKITNVRTANLPELRFIGKRCKCDPKDFITTWNEWLEKGWFNQLEKLGVAPENEDAYWGVTTDDGSYYWIGLLFPPDTSVPNGFEYSDSPAANYAVFEFEGIKEGELFGEDGIMLVFEEMSKRNMVSSEGGWGLERYNPPSTDGKGTVFIEFLNAIR